MGKAGPGSLADLLPETRQGELSQDNHYFECGREQVQFVQKIGQAFIRLIGSGLVSGGRTAVDTADKYVIEYQPVIAGNGLGLVGKARFKKRSVKPVS